MEQKKFLYISSKNIYICQYILMLIIYVLYDQKSYSRYIYTEMFYEISKGIYMNVQVLYS